MREGKKVPCKATIKISLLKEPPVQVGDTVLISITAQPSKRERALFKEGLSCSLYLPVLPFTLLSRPRVSFARWRSQKRKQILKSLSKKLSPLTFSFMSALVLGTRPDTALYKTIAKHCSYWGIAHYLARSGLHVVITVYCSGTLITVYPSSFFYQTAAACFSHFDLSPLYLAEHFFYASTHHLLAF